MTVMLHDTHNNAELQKELDQYKILGTIFDEVLVGVIVIDKLEFAKEFEDALDVVDSVVTETSVKVCITCPAGGTNPLLASSV
jgi:hypothetical protein